MRSFGKRIRIAMKISHNDNIGKDLKKVFDLNGTSSIEFPNPFKKCKTVKIEERTIVIAMRIKQ